MFERQLLNHGTYLLVVTRWKSLDEMNTLIKETPLTSLTYHCVSLESWRWLTYHPRGHDLSMRANVTELYTAKKKKWCVPWGTQREKEPEGYSVKTIPRPKLFNFSAQLTDYQRVYQRSTVIAPISRGS